MFDVQPLVWRLKFKLGGRKRTFSFGFVFLYLCCNFLLLFSFTNLSHPSLCVPYIFRNFTCSGWRSFAASLSSHIFSRRTRWDTLFSDRSWTNPSFFAADLLGSSDRVHPSVWFLLCRLWGALFCSCTTPPERPKFGWSTLGRRFSCRPRWPWTTGRPGLKATGRKATCGDWTTS